MTGSPPAIPVFAAGYGYLPTDFDNLIQTPMTFLTTGVVFRAEMHSSQSLTGGTTTLIHFDTIVEDPYSGWNATSFLWLAPYTGWYQITMTSTISVTSTRISATIETPEGNLTGSAHTSLGTFPAMATATANLPLLGGTDTIGGATLTSTTTTTNTAAGRYTTLEITFVSQ